MRTMHKHKIELAGNTPVSLPPDAVFRHVEYVFTDKALYLWVEVNADNFVAAPEAGAIKLEHNIHVFKSGVGIPGDYEYLGTGVDNYLPEAYHVYLHRDVGASE